MEGTSITDLSDPIRPQKVCEMFSELYDYQWTEAFECLTSEAKTTDSRSNRDITQRLLNTLMVCLIFYTLYVFEPFKATLKTYL